MWPKEHMDTQCSCHVKGWRNFPPKWLEENFVPFFPNISNNDLQQHGLNCRSGGHGGSERINNKNKNKSKKMKWKVLVSGVRSEVRKAKPPFNL